MGSEKIGKGLSLTQYQKGILDGKQLDRYLSPLSNKQVSYLLHLNKPAVYYRLCQLISKFARAHNFPRAIYELLKNRDLPDADLYSAVLQVSSARTKGGQMYNKNGKDDRTFVAEYLLNLLNNLNFRPKSLLDIGCGNCILTRDLGRLAGMNRADVYGADIKEEFEKNWITRRPDEINFVEIEDNKLRFDRKFDLITCIMVLHHVDAAEEYISDIYQMLNPKGVFLIKEHDCINYIDYMMADIEHSLYIAQESAIRREIPIEAKTRILQQSIHYRSRFEWRILIEKAGFNCIYEEPYDLGISGNYSPTRGYIAVFSK